jgi:hypothetical protein
MGVTNLMRPAFRAVPTAKILLLGGLAGFLIIAQTGAAENAPPAKSARGGLLAKTERHQFEVFFYPTGIRLFPQDLEGKPLDSTNVTAIAIFYHPNSPDPWFDRPLRPVSVAAGESPSSLEDVIDLVTVPASGARVVFEVSGLADPAEPGAAVSIPVEFVASQVAAPSGESSASPRYVYAAGFQGVGYYANPGPQSPPRAAAATRPVPPPRSSGNSTGGSTRGRSVGPGVRDWSTGRSGRLHKPWMQGG